MAKFHKVASIFDQIEGISSRTDITSLLISLLKELDESEAQIFCYLLKGRVAPIFVPAEFNMSEKSILKVLTGYNKFTDTNVTSIREDLGDIGDTTFHVLKGLEGSAKGIELVELYDKLWELVNLTGSGSSANKQSVLAELFNQVSALEAKYISRIVTGKLRLGASDGTVLDALSMILTGSKDARELLDNCYGVDPDLGQLTYRVVLANGDLTELAPEVKIGIPVRSRLVERVKEFSEVFERLGDSFYVQPKYDGLRCQVHKGVSVNSDVFSQRVWGSRLINMETTEISMFDTVATEGNQDVRLFSRNLEDITQMFPDVVDAVSELNDDPFILDCEIVGWNEDNMTFAPFQETMTRKRKHGITEATESVPVRLYPFDALMAGGDDLLEVEVSERLKRLEKIVKGDRGSVHGDKDKDAGVIHLSETILINDIDQLEEEFNKAVGAGLEGLIAKQFEGGYQPGKRNYEWIKLKKSMLSILVDSVDLLVMGYYYGSGRQTSFGMGALLGGVYDKKSGKFLSTTKIGTGVTDEQWSMIAKKLKGVEIKVPPKEYDVHDNLKPDVWVLPKVVCTVEADEITRSKVHRAGVDELGYGLALRFPRMIEFDRDKDPEDATSVDELIRLYQ